MRRVLPAHVLLGALVAGLAAANAVRIAWMVVFAVAAGATVLRPRLAAGAVVFAVAGWAWGSARLDVLDHSVLHAQIGRAGLAQAVTVAEARVGRFDARQFAVVTAFSGRPLHERVELELPLGRAPPQGARIGLLAEVRAPRGPADGFDERTWLRRQGVHVVLRVDRWHPVGHREGVPGLGDALRRWLRRASTPGLTGERRAVLNGILLGDDVRLTPETKSAFRRSGLYHLLAVSGQNVVLLAGGVLVLVWLAGLRRIVGHLCVLAAILAYVVAVGPQPSVIRAAVAGCAVSVAWLAGRERERWHILLVAAAALLAWNPYALFDAGFQLSFAAVAAIFVAARPVLAELEGYPVPSILSGTVAVSTVCGAATAPILWLQFGQVPLLGVVSNAFAEPAVAPLLALAFGAAALDPFAPRLAESLAWLNGWLAEYIVLCARAVAAVPGAQARGRGAAIVVSGILVAAAYAWRRWRTSSRLRT